MRTLSHVSAMLMAIAVFACGRTSLDVPGGYVVDQESGGSTSTGAGGTYGGDGSGGYAGLTASVTNAGGLGPRGGRQASGGAAVGGARYSTLPISSGGRSAEGGTYATGGTTTGGTMDTSSSYSSGGASGAGGFPIAQPGLALTDVLPLLTPSTYNITCASLQCGTAMACSNDPSCAWEVSCLVNDCRVAARSSQPDPSLVESDACVCLTQLATRCENTTDVRGCLGNNCQAVSPSTALGGLQSVSCVIGCSGTLLCPYHGH